MKKGLSLNLRLLKDGNGFREFLKDPDSCDELRVSKEVAKSAHIYVARNPKKRPRWFPLIELCTPDALPDILTQSSGALIIMMIDKSYFAYSFGQGRHLLKSDISVKDFGLKVVLNSVDPDRIRSVDSQSIEDNVVNTQRHASRLSSIESFGLDVARDLMRAATGIPRDPDLALSVSGSEALSFYAKMDESELELKCRQFLKEYKKKTYKERFPWIDNLIPIKDKSICAELDEELDKDLRKKTESLYLAPPGPIPWNESPEFTFRLKSKEFGDDTATPDLMIEKYYRLLEGKEEISLARLKKSDRVIMTYGEADLTQRWPLYDCLVYETKYKNTHYFLSEGEWYSVNKNYRSRISDLIDTIPELAIELPSASEDQSEGEYNLGAAASSDSLVLMDRVLIPTEGRSSIELCDLLSKERQLIHVKKRRGGSSSLSHLFAQGRIAATLLLEDAQFRKDARAQIKIVDEGFVQVIPESNVDPRMFEIVYAIISGVKEDQWQQQLPFFSRINLVESFKALRRMQFKGVNFKRCGNW